MQFLTKLFLAAAAGLSFFAHASEQVEYPAFQQIDAKIREVGAKFGNANTLLVFDTDDTLLVLNQDIGSEKWYEWQTTDAQCEQTCTPKMKEAPGADSVAKDLSELLDQLGKVLYLSHAHPNEAQIPASLAKLQSDGFQAVVLTSRGFLNRDATQRQYMENGITFSRVGLNAAEEGREYTPQVTPAEMQKFGIKSVRPVNYTRGIINTDGQHKGAMLTAWLREVGVHPRAIVFVDNESRQTGRVFSAFSDTEIDITTIRYSHSDQDRDLFWASDKANAISEWKQFLALIGGVFH